mmetsp:Transcript_25389/g.64544  ORF Transcript_25389/g.64544 Transcript_25389/m.64544 type:complete len:1062 (-) Transcript_25389:323-3508(-)
MLRRRIAAVCGGVSDTPPRSATDEQECTNKPDALQEERPDGASDAEPRTRTEAEALADGSNSEAEIARAGGVEASAASTSPATSSGQSRLAREGLRRSLREILVHGQCQDIFVEFTPSGQREAALIWPPVQLEHEGRSPDTVVEELLELCSRGGAAAAKDDDASETLTFGVTLPPAPDGQCGKLVLGGVVLDIDAIGGESVSLGVPADKLVKWLARARLPPEGEAGRRWMSSWNCLTVGAVLNGWVACCVLYSLYRGYMNMEGVGMQVVARQVQEAQLQRSLESIPVPEDSPVYQQYRDYYLQAYEEALAQAQWSPNHWLQVDWQALWNSLQSGLFLVILNVLLYVFARLYYSYVSTAGKGEDSVSEQLSQATVSAKAVNGAIRPKIAAEPQEVAMAAPRPTTPDAASADLGHAQCARQFIMEGPSGEPDVVSLPVHPSKPADSKPQPVPRIDYGASPQRQKLQRKIAARQQGGAVQAPAADVADPKPLDDPLANEKVMEALLRELEDTPKAKKKRQAQNAKPTAPLKGKEGAKEAKGAADCTAEHADNTESLPPPKEASVTLAPRCPKGAAQLQQASSKLKGSQDAPPAAKMSLAVVAPVPAQSVGAVLKVRPSPDPALMAPPTAKRQRPKGTDTSASSVGLGAQAGGDPNGTVQSAQAEFRDGAWDVAKSRGAKRRTRTATDSEPLGGNAPGCAADAEEPHAAAGSAEDGLSADVEAKMAVLEELQQMQSDELLSWFKANSALEWLQDRMKGERSAVNPSKTVLLEQAAVLLGAASGESRREQESDSAAPLQAATADAAEGAAGAACAKEPAKLAEAVPPPAAAASFSAESQLATVDLAVSGDATKAVDDKLEPIRFGDFDEAQRPDLPQAKEAVTCDPARLGAEAGNGKLAERTKSTEAVGCVAPPPAQYMVLMQPAMARLVQCVPGTSSPGADIAPDAQPLQLLPIDGSEMAKQGMPLMMQTVPGMQTISMATGNQHAVQLGSQQVMPFMLMPVGDMDMTNYDMQSVQMVQMPMVAGSLPTAAVTSTMGASGMTFLVQPSASGQPGQSGEPQGPSMA